MFADPCGDISALKKVQRVPGKEINSPLQHHDRYTSSFIERLPRHAPVGLAHQERTPPPKGCWSKGSAGPMMPLGFRVYLGFRI